MGYHVHHALLVTSWKVEAVSTAYEQTRAILASHNEADGTDFTRLLTPLTEGVTNGFVSFAVLPDGSKEGWSTSDAMDAARDEVVAMLRGLIAAYEFLDFVELSFGGDEGDINTRILRHDVDEEAFPTEPDSE